MSRLKHIETMSFNSSEHTLYLDLIERYPHLSALKANEVVLIRSRTGNQLVFIIGFGNVNDTHGVHQYLRSERLRLTHRTPWNPLMLQNYANEVGIELEGIKRFEEHLIDYAKAREARRAAAAKKKKKAEK